MRGNRNALVLLLLFVCCTGSALAQQPFTYQGMLKNSGVPATGNFDFQFSLWTALSGGSQLGSTLTKSNVNVQNGLFTTELDFGAVWDGNDRYLQIAVRPSGSGSYTTLSPRVKVTRVPYSQLAYSALTVPWSGIVGVPSSFPPGGPAGGDLSGTYPNPLVVGIQGLAVANTRPNPGQVLKWDGARWSPADDLRDALWQASGSDIFYTAGRVGIGTNSPAYQLHVETAAGNRAIYGLHNATSGTTTGGWFENASPWGRGVFGSATAGSGYTTGVYGQSASTSGRGVYGVATAASGYTTGGWFESASTSGRGVFGFATASSGYTTGVQGQSSSPNGTGVVGYATASSGEPTGVFGRSDGTSGTGVYGVHAATSGTAPGVHGVTNSTSSEAVGVLGEVKPASPGASSAGVRGINRGTGFGVYGSSVSGSGVVGRATASSGYNHGVYGQSDSLNGYGVYGVAPTRGVYGSTTETGFTFTFGVVGHIESLYGYAVLGTSAASSGFGYGVLGAGYSPDGGGVHGHSGHPSGYGVYSMGRFAATGTKSFQMDHPLNPENAYLNHFCFEGPEPQNVYNGTVVLDARGEAWVQLPDYFEAINRDPRYTLTPIGAPMPDLHVAVEIQGNRFKIAGGVPGKRVSWEVKAIRNDRWVQEYGYQTEQPKPSYLRGKYLHPELYGQPKELGIHYRPMPEREVTPPAPKER